MSFVNYLDDIIRKSTFTISKYVDGFIAPNGHFISCESHHHVETALSILKKHDDDIKCRIKSFKSSYKKRLKTIDTLNKIINLINDDYINNIVKINRLIKTLKSWNIYNAENYLNKNALLEKILHEKYSEEYLADYDKRRFENEGKISYIEAFKKANKNKGYDAAEFIITNYNYIAVENGYLLYRNANNSQLHNYNCYIEKDDNSKIVICPLSDKQIKDKKEDEIKQCLNLVDYYKKSENRFHCPSGFIRCDYIRWQRQCRELGLDPDFLISPF